MNTRDFVGKLGFSPKENTIEIFHKKYKDYSIEIDFDKNQFNFGGIITFGDSSKTIQNIVKPEDWVVLECVNRLLEKGYKPEDIILEKIYPSGHGHSGRLDILVKKGEKSFLMIECKTFGKEYKKELLNIHKKGGQLFTYFQNDTNTEFLMLYTSSLFEENIVFKNEIIKVEENYRTAGNVEDVFNRWNKVSNQNGIFEDWVEPYNFQNKLLTKNELKPLNQEDSGFIFHEFLSILRKHSVSDKPNAFNKIFNLFLAKIYDEKKRPNDELDFQWREKTDTAVDFQIRLINLYKEGMLAFLEKEVAGINDDDFKYFPPEKLAAQKKKWLMFNNVFAIKEVIDNESFDDNQRVLKEVVELLHKFQIRYPRRQQHLSDFFERLLTTGLKQEVGQYFTPPPITKFIIKSLPVEKEIKNSLNNPIAELPAVIDYAVGSGHFITEMLEEYQTVIDSLETKNFYPEIVKKVNTWVEDKYAWASKYVYGVDKDYRLVKVAKVGCYFYGDGLAQIIHGDGLDNFAASKSFRGLLKQKENTPDNGKFSFVISNPPYSVSSFKSDLKNTNADKDFDLYKYLTDRSSEIECLFIERTKQLLKEDGIASLVLPSSILSNSGIYAKAREIILKDFDIIAITELGSGTFMATGTNTVVLFLKRRKTSFAIDIKEKVNASFLNNKDVTINGIETPITKYVNRIWENISFEDYKTLLKNKPNDVIKQHVIYKEYLKKIKAKNETDKNSKILKLEREKCFYFILAFNQKVVLVKTGNKKEEKQFLGYEFSNRRGSEGMHPIQRGKSIDECTRLFANTDNPEKANYYIKKAFTENSFDLEIPENLQKNISYQNLTDLLTFDRAEFDKSISLSFKKKVEIKSKWEFVRLGNETDLITKGTTPTSLGYTFVDKGISFIKIESIHENGSVDKNKFAFIDNETNKKLSRSQLKENDILFSIAGALGRTTIVNDSILPANTNQALAIIRLKTKSKLSTIYLNLILRSWYIQSQIDYLKVGLAQSNLSLTQINEFQIPLPPKNIQEKIVAEIEILREKENTATKKIEDFKNDIVNLFENSSNKNSEVLRLSNSNIFEVSIGKRLLKREILEEGEVQVFSANVFEAFGYVNKYLIEDFSKPSILWGIDGDWMVNYIKENIPFYPTDHCGVLRIKDNTKVNERYITYFLRKEGIKQEFSRTKRASIGKIQGIKLSLPSIEEQQKIVSEIKKIEAKIAVLENEISKIPIQKEAVLKKYL